MEGFDKVLDLTKQIAERHAQPSAAQAAGIDVCRAIFPHWIPPLFTMFVSWPLAKQSMQINAWGVQLTCQWLLGETEVVDVEMDGGRLGKGNGLLIKRCRYLEESGCASVCINMCKVPTQEYFRKYMGVPLTMQPNYDDYSCLASFGRTPPAQQEDPVFDVPCFSNCSSRKRNAHRATPGAGCHLLVGEGAHGAPELGGSDVAFVRY